MTATTELDWPADGGLLSQLLLAQRAHAAAEDRFDEALSGGAEAAGAYAGVGGNGGGGGGSCGRSSYGGRGADGQGSSALQLPSELFSYSDDDWADAAEDTLGQAAKGVAAGPLVALLGPGAAPHPPHEGVSAGASGCFGGAPSVAARPLLPVPTAAAAIAAAEAVWREQKSAMVAG